MVPMPESSFFPPLDKCLSGEQLLLSWKIAFFGVTATEEAGINNESAIAQFLKDPEVANRLEKPFDAFPAPTSQTKAAFEQKTSAINATPLSSSRYDIKQIKEDALWLSEAARIDEVSSLRIVLEECQSRTASQLMGHFSEEELASIREAAGNSKYSSSVPVSLLSQGAEPAIIQAEFERQDNRRPRILQTYLSERRYILKCVEFLIRSAHGCNPQESGKGKESQIASSWLDTFSVGFLSKLSPNDDFIICCCKAIAGNIKNISSGNGWSLGDGNLDLKWIQSQIMEVTHYMEIIFQLINSSADCTSSQVLLEWLRIMASCGFFEEFDIDDADIQPLILPLQTLASIITLSMFSLDTCLEFLGDEAGQLPTGDEPVDGPYILNTTTISQIHAILLNAAEVGFRNAGPAILAWAVLIQNLDLMVQGVAHQEEHDSPDLSNRQVPVDPAAAVTYQEVMRQVKDSLEEDAADVLARTAVNSCRVFETVSSFALRLGNTPSSFFPSEVGAQMRILMLSLIANSTGVGYIPEIVEATISVLSGGQSYWDILDSPTPSSDCNPMSKFWQNDCLVSAILENAVSRYPYEALPFLQLIRALAASVDLYGTEDSRNAITYLETIQTFTYQLSEGFVDYETTQEEENNNNILLTRPIPLFESKFRFQGSHLALTTIDEEFTIPRGALGRIVSDSGPKVAYWSHPYSGLKYLGKLLETFLTAHDEIDSTTGMPVAKDFVCEIIGLLSNLLLGISRSSDHSEEDAQQILKTASAWLNRNQDIISVVFDIFEEELQKQAGCTGADVPLELLVSCVQFIHAILPIYPQRVWPALAQSGLLGVTSRGARLSVLVDSVELLSGRYTLLISCCRLFESLVNDLVTNAMGPPAGRKHLGRFIKGEGKERSSPEQILSKTLLAFTRYLVYVFGSSTEWRYTTDDDHRTLSYVIGKTFNNILLYAYGIESAFELTTIATDPRPPQKNNKEGQQLMQALMPSASHIVDSFLSISSGTFRFQPLLRSYYDGLETPDLTGYDNLLSMWKSHVISILQLSKTLLRVSSLLEYPPSQLEANLFRSSPILARLYAVNIAYKNPVAALFEALILTASSHTSEPPSLLGHLGPQTARNFLHMLTDLDRPLSRSGSNIQIWNFLSAVMKSRQQWFANYLLTGKTPREALQKKTNGRDLATIDRTLLTIALESLLNLDIISQPEALAMLEFVALAQNFWPWPVYNSPNHADFIKSVSEFVGTLKPIQPASRSEIALEGCYQTRIAAYVAEILAMSQFHARQTGAASQLKDLMPNLAYFARFAVVVPSYNPSLHSQLKRNFEARYPDRTLRDLKKTQVSESRYGSEYFYDMALAENMLHDHEAWTGRKNDGLRAEFSLANVNLSLVDAQIALFQNWRFLATELSSNIAAEIDLQKMLVKVATDCLVANQRSQLPEDVFTRLSQTRADLSLVLIQRLIETKSKVPEMKGLLKVIWETIRSLRGTFERPLPDNEIDYYRSLLKLLYLAVTVHAESNSPQQAENFRSSLRMNETFHAIPILLDILKYVIAIGLRELVSSIHESAESSSPGSVALLTGILQAILRVPGIELNYNGIVSIFTSHDTARIATTLYSWSDNLAVNGDPIYGELSLLFLVELSSIQPMAEQMAIDGLLGHVASASLANYLRSGKVGPFAESAGLQRCYSIWVRGILPLLLNLLDAVQVNVSAEVALFLRQFSSLLNQASQALDAPETNRLLAKGTSKYVTLSIVSEIHSLGLITYILNGFREAQKGRIEIGDVDWDVAGVLENVDFWLGSRGLLKDRILPMGERENEMARKKVGEVSALEARIVKELLGTKNVLVNGGD